MQTSTTTRSLLSPGTSVLSFRRPPDPLAKELKSPVMRPILSLDLEPDPLVVACWASRPETAVLAFRHAPDPMESAQSGPLASAPIVSPGTDVRTFRHPPDPLDFRCAPDPAELTRSCPLAIGLAACPSTDVPAPSASASPGTEILSFRRPPDPRCGGDGSLEMLATRRLLPCSPGTISVFIFPRV